MDFWILKTEPGTYAYEDLMRDQCTHWDGVRNYQARNNLKAMNEGDHCLIYHSVGPKSVVGLSKVTKSYYQDPTTDDERWVVVDIEAVEQFKNPLTLAAMKSEPGLEELSLIKQSRLSVCPISKPEYEIIVGLCR